MFNSRMSVVAGLHKRSEPNPQEIQRKPVAAIINHGGYNEYTNVNDIAIVRLASPVTLNSYVNFACLPGVDPALNENVMIGM
jgi:secreted trypsin-like serine protease